MNSTKHQSGSSLLSKRQLLIDVIKGMKQRDQILLALRFTENLSVPKIAKVLGWTETEVAQRLHRVTSTVEIILGAKVRKRHVRRDQLNKEKL